MLGVQERFSPEKLATTASGALTALFLEIIVSIFYIISYGNTDKRPNATNVLMRQTS